MRIPPLVFPPIHPVRGLYQSRTNGDNGALAPGRKPSGCNPWAWEETPSFPFLTTWKGMTRLNEEPIHGRLTVVLLKHRSMSKEGDAAGGRPNGSEPRLSRAGVGRLSLYLR